MAQKTIQTRSNSWGITSFILGLISLFTGALGFLFGIGAIIAHTQQSKVYSNGLNTAGLVLGIIGTVLGAFFISLLLFMFMVLGAVA